MLQWCNEPDQVFRECRRVLPGRLLTYTTFGPDTLYELRRAWSAADGLTHVNRFIDMHDLGDAMVRSGLAEPVMDVDRCTLTYADARDLMRDLKAIGAHNVNAGRAPGLTGKSRLARMIASYEEFRRDGRLPATYEVIYGQAWAPQPDAVRRRHASDEVRVPSRGSAAIAGQSPCELLKRRESATARWLNLLPRGRRGRPERAARRRNRAE